MQDDRNLYRLRPGFTHTARGEHRRKNKTLLPGDEIRLTPAQAEAFKDRFVLVDVAKAQDKVQETYKKSQTKGLRVEPNGSGKYNVINEETGKQLNDTPLTKPQAEAMQKQKEA